MVAKTHGLSRTPLYYLWNSIRQRCLNEEHPSYRHYGGRGITMCDEWLNDPAAFSTWILENIGPRPKGKYIDRIDNDGDYEPGNLRWATMSEQMRNRRAFGASGYRGVTRVGDSWIASIGVDSKTRHLGSYATPEEAAAAYEGARRLLEHLR